MTTATLTASEMVAAVTLKIETAAHNVGYFHAMAEKNGGQRALSDARLILIGIQHAAQAVGIDTKAFNAIAQPVIDAAYLGALK